VFKHSYVYVTENIRPVEVVGLDMQKIRKDIWDRPRTHGLEPDLSDLHRGMAASSVGILILLHQQSVF